MQRPGLLARDADSALPGAESKGNEFLACLGSRDLPLGTGIVPCPTALHPLLLSDHCWLHFNALEQTDLTRDTLRCF